ncbi:hypothetical protein A2276_08350 [candidate division WOR-1 bacterium RIFOXYA12_FULL_43_27]|uniref:Uncharacterized protein n=1 Tax=candidate division WOR-1 bacterium RIFOXYC2_FULL_46_14 TaxID=1802587 RepID=A0A1F4U649_UNCSA|nr:MAG: hypothetical protein A2276_08350 [candidate division WOR-1 bacterium RIFOXYA12_FULL_43_27]OGC20604.1 MAG: hypothetical protein A2292_06175 [candidate division WOR-1 bacterium RIFOXYB2_FULL_46_45]OGC31659.1 MAG: hypothetical protein A2232_05275 [candidate division WOR-1 bacterium RIFOXYA2_FULL_46_56]OGC40445.1 MAG: hypothetical protein A2438_04205 [candidate division WOR-1 bacterium RIFOXYC2_FULL_46_14]
MKKSFSVLFALVLLLLVVFLLVYYFVGGCGRTATTNNEEYLPVLSSYNTFTLSTKPISVAISQDGVELVPLTVLALSSDESKGIKNSALAMAIGYCVFLKLTDLENELTAAGATSAETNDIMTGANVNQWLATAFQETRFAPITEVLKSGYYQIDDKPSTVAEGMGEYYAFLNNLDGGATFVYPTNYPTLNKINEKGFVWSSVEKGYYEAKSYSKNRVAYNNRPYSDFNLAKWAVAYTRKNGSTQYPFKTSVVTSEAPGTLGAFNCFGQVMSYFYNRGQNPFTNPDTWPPSKVITDAFGTSSSDLPLLEVSATYEVGSSSVAYGKRYIWQLGWLNAMLNASADVYTEEISLQDVKDVLTILKGFYSGEVAANDTAVVAAIASAEAIDASKWGHAYNSAQTFENVYNITSAMMEASK